MQRICKKIGWKREKKIVMARKSDADYPPETWLPSSPPESGYFSLPYNFPSLSFSRQRNEIPTQPTALVR